MLLPVGENKTDYCLSIRIVKWISSNPPVQKQLPNYSMCCVCNHLLFVLTPEVINFWLYSINVVIITCNAYSVNWISNNNNNNTVCMQCRWRTAVCWSSKEILVVQHSSKYTVVDFQKSYKTNRLGWTILVKNSESLLTEYLFSIHVNRIWYLV